jgi:N-acetylglucosaminyldiphosphoundecaprenol N-acetyl-beta-D-mannosaminyltransferase
VGRATPERVRVLGLPIDPLTMRETVAYVERALAREGPPLQHTVVNAAKVVQARREPLLRSSIEESDLVNADGQAVVWAARLLGQPLPERVAGIDLMWALLERANERGYRVFLLGATSEVVESVVERIRRELPGVQIAGSHHGYFGEADARDVAATVAASRPDILFVAMPTPRKEQFIHEHLATLGTRFAMGVGGSFDVLAGVTRRAPLLVQRAGLEWAYRLAQEPRRLFRRYAVTNARFVGLVARELLRGTRRAR